MYKLFIQQCGQRYASPWQKSNFCFYRKILMQVRALGKIYPLNLLLFVFTIFVLSILVAVLPRFYCNSLHIAAHNMIYYLGLDARKPDIVLQLTIRGSGKHKQTITKLPARRNKNLHFQEQWGWHCADEIVTSIPTRLKPVLDHFQNSN